MCHLFPSRYSRGRTTTDRNKVGRQKLFYPILIDGVFFINKRIRITCRKFQYGITGISGNYIPLILRIQSPQLFQVYLKHFRYLLQMQHLVHMNGICCQRQISLQRAKVMIAIIIHHIISSNKQWHIRTGFFRQVRKYIPEVRLSTRTFDCFIDISRSAIIGCHHQAPVFIDSIHILEISASCFCSLHRIATVVHQTVNRQSILFTGRKHELPQPTSSNSRQSNRIQGTFNHSQVFQFDRQAMFIKYFFYDREIIVGHAQHITHQISAPFGIKINTIAYYIVIWHGDNTGQTSQTAGIYRVGEINILFIIMTIILPFGEILYMP